MGSLRTKKKTPTTELIVLFLRRFFSTKKTIRSWLSSIVIDMESFIILSFFVNERKDKFVESKLENPKFYSPTKIFLMSLTVYLRIKTLMQMNWDNIIIFCTERCNWEGGENSHISKVLHSRAMPKNSSFFTPKKRCLWNFFHPNCSSECFRDACERYRR